MKVQKTTFLSPFGGLNYVLNELDKHGIGDILDSYLPNLAPQSKYSWRDIIFSYWSVFFCGGDCAEDLDGNLKNTLKDLPHLSLPSPDRVLDRLKELSIPAVIFNSPRSKAYHEFAVNEHLNQLNLTISKQLFKGLPLNATLDYDNTICYTEKKDATRTYMFEKGYQPGVAFIGSQVVYVENRTRNSSAQVGQDETLFRMFSLLKQHGISIKKFRADSATYSLKTLRVVERYAEHYYIRARMSHVLENAIASISNWENVSDTVEEKLRGETVFIPFERAIRDVEQKNLKTYRIIVTKTKRKDGQVNFFTGEAYLYSVILTNDYEMTANQIVQFYNQRATAEREFEVLKYDFGWNKLPFSNLAQNNVYLLITAMCRNIYHYIIRYFSKIVKGLKPEYRLKKFIFRFICVPAKWINHARQWHLRLYGNIAFET